MAQVHLGIDLGSTGLRAAYSVTGGPARLVALSGPQWLHCEPAASSPLPVQFPGTRSRLGLTGPGGLDAPEQVLVAALGEIRRRVGQDTSAAIGSTVVSVPCRYGSRQRAALLKIAAEAELGAVSLVTDTVAAVVGHAGAEGTGTYLVYGMGYSGFELGVVRVVRGRFRVLGYESGESPGGRALDEQVLAGWLTTLAAHGSLPDEVRQGPEGWLRLRGVAEKVKEQLAVADAPVLFPQFARGRDRRLVVAVQFGHDSFELLVRSEVARTLNSADVLFEHVGLGRDDIGTVLLVGGSTRMRELRKLVSGLGGAVVPTGPEHVARGALAHAHRLTSRSPAQYEEQPDWMGVAPEPVADAPGLSGTLLAAPGLALGPSGETAGLERARQLFERGHVEEAEAELRRLMDAAQGLLDEITARPVPSAAVPPPTEPKPAAPVSPAAELLALARKRLDDRKYQEAIELSHLAWEREPNRPDVFDSMIDVHCAAAMAAPTPSSFTRDENWLRCAYEHDPSNARVRGLLAERCYRHGRDLHRSGRAVQARHAVEEALSWNPDHPGAEELLRRLGRR